MHLFVQNFNDVYEWTISGDNKYVMVVENYTENVVGNGHTAFYKTFNVDSAEQIDISVNGQRVYTFSPFLFLDKL